VVPKARRRGIDVFAWDYNNADVNMPRAHQELHARARNRRLTAGPAHTPCFNNRRLPVAPLRAKIEDYLKTFPELSGIGWGCERMGPLMNMIGRRLDYALHQLLLPVVRAQSRARAGVSIGARAPRLSGADRLFHAAPRDQRRATDTSSLFGGPARIHPKSSQWEKLWTDSYHENPLPDLRHRQSHRAGKPIGWHIMHNKHAEPLYRAEEDFARNPGITSDFIKQVVYNNCAGQRMAGLPGPGSAPRCFTTPNRKISAVLTTKL
jgi:hypothetical protein